MKLLISLILSVLFFAASADVRTVAVDSIEKDRSGRIIRANLRLTEGADAVLHVAWGLENVGDDIDAWDSCLPVAIIPGSKTTFTYEFPANVGDDVKAARFFLLEDFDIPLTKRYAWIGTDGNQVIDTTFIPSGQSSVEMKISLNSVDRSAALFCARSKGNSDDSFTAFYIAEGGWRFDYFKQGSASQPVAEANQIYVLKADGTGMYIDGDLISKQFIQDKKVAGLPLLLFGSRFSQGGRIENKASLKMYSLKAYHDINDKSSVALDLIPTEKDGVVCLYNRVDGSYLKSYPYDSHPLIHGEEVDFSRPGIISRSEVLSGSFGAERYVNIVAKRRSDATKRIASVDLSFTAGLPRKLYVAYGNKDMGDDITEWESVLFVDDISGDTTEYTFDIPESWEMDIAAIRFFLCGSEFYPGCESLCEGVKVDNVYVATSFIPTFRSIIDMTLSFSTVSESQTIFCARGPSNGPKSMTLFYLADGGWRLDRNSNQTISHVLAEVSKRYSITAGVFGLRVNNSSVIPRNEFLTEYTAGSTLALLMSSYSGHPENGSYPFTGTIYSFKAVQDSTDPDSVVLDLVPCVKDGKPHLYNRVDGEFFDFRGSGTATAVGVFSNGSSVSSTEVLNINPKGLRLSVR